MPEKNKSAAHPIRKEIGKYFLYFFVCAWMFWLGVLVGRGTAPVKFNTKTLQMELEILKKEAIQEETEKIETDAENLSQKSNLSFPDALKESRYSIGPVADFSEQPEKRETEAPLPEKIPEKTALATKKDNTFETEEIVESPQPDTTKVAPMEETETSKMIIQVASFKNLEDAERMVAQLKERGYAAYKASAEVPGSGTWHRVRIGYFAKRVEARDTMERLRKENLIGMLINIEN